MRANPALLMTSALAASGLWAGEAPLAVQVRCPDVPAAYCDALVAELQSRMPQAAFGADPAPDIVTLTLTGRTTTRISGHLTLARAGQAPMTTPDAVVMLMDGAPETLAPRQLAATLADLALPALTPPNPPQQ